ncbi:MAG TPA: type II toxin-antitoxin system death-on-curing family toxin [Candidatus Saccharimonadia bacterium]|jgi:death-on-curing protein
MIVLTLEQLLELHALAIETTGGSAGLRDLGRLEAALAAQTQNVFGEELYPTIIDKAAALIRGLIADHAFVNGNKPTAMLAGITLLVLNDLPFSAQARDIENFAVEVATKHLDVPNISTWLRQRTKHGVQ